MKRLFLLLLIVFVSGCSTNRDRHIQWEAETPTDFPKLTAVGYASLAKQPGKTKSDKVLAALQASKVDAYRELAEQIYGQKIDGVTNTHEWKLKHDEVRASVSGVVRGAKVVKSYLSGDFYVTELELDYKHVWALYQQRQKNYKVKRVVYF
ncbi:flagellar biosynthesis protein FlgP [Shewanella sp. OPT22]|nr:flagellar biosynthesis protein FlgP [Shewanella sp. OPT22]